MNKKRGTGPRFDGKALIGQRRVYAQNMGAGLPGSITHPSLALAITWNDDLAVLKQGTS
jgi:hypothetical protein